MALWPAGSASFPWLLLSFCAVACVTPRHGSPSSALAARVPPPVMAACAPDQALAPCLAAFRGACAADPVYCAALAMNPALARLGDERRASLEAICQDDVVVGCGLLSQERFAANRYDEFAEGIDQELCLDGGNVRERSLRSPSLADDATSAALRRASEGMSRDACQRLDRTYRNFLSANPVE